jgi:hypothetical protein
VTGMVLPSTLSAKVERDVVLARYDAKSSISYGATTWSAFAESLVSIGERLQVIPSSDIEPASSGLRQ